MSDIESGHDSNPLGANDASIVTNLPHLVIEIAGSDQKFVLFIDRAGDGVFLPKDLHLDGR